MSQVPHQEPCSTAQSEARLYVPDHEGWSAAIKRDWNKEYCFAQNPGEDSLPPPPERRNLPAAGGRKILPQLRVAARSS